MTFVSLSFLFFILICTILYFAVPKKIRWIILLAGSMVFYLISSGALLLFLILAAAVTFFAGIRIETIRSAEEAYLETHQLGRAEKKERKLLLKKRLKTVLVPAILIVLGFLLVLKYYNFFVGNLNLLTGLFGVTIPLHTFLLPLGISFYTLQSIAYMTDVYRGQIKADRNFLKFLLFMSFFPQIVQGPIPRYSGLAAQLYEGHDFDYDRVTKGLQLALWGYFKKVAIADLIAIPTNQLFDHSAEYAGLFMFLAGVFYGLQVYADFSGGMDIARGISQIFGIELDINFRQPYFSRSIEEFWRRWHITLGGFMRDYVFYPLSLSAGFTKLGKAARKKVGAYVGNRLPSFLSMFIVYLLVGFWHGASWNYIAYGIWNGVFIMGGILLDEKYLKLKERLHIAPDSKGFMVFQMIRTFILCSIGRLFSRASGLQHALSMMGSMVTGPFGFSKHDLLLNLTKAQWLTLGLALIIAFIVEILHERGVEIRNALGRKNIVLRWVLIFGCLAWILTFGVYGPAYDAASFVYEQF